MVNVYKGGIIMLKLIEIPESIKNIYLVDTENCYPEIISSKNNLYIYFLGHNKKIQKQSAIASLCYNSLIVKQMEKMH